MFNCEKEKMDNSFSLKYFVVKHSSLVKKITFLQAGTTGYLTEWYEC